MKNYAIVEDKNTFIVKEVKTDHIVGSFKKICDARAFMNKMNAGHGFDGWTPKFFLN